MSLLFRLALFLREEKSQFLKLIPTDLTILFMLASHIGENEYWYLNQASIARECRIKTSHFYRRMKHLEKLKLLHVRRTGKANAYSLILSTDQYSSTEQRNSDPHSSTDQISTGVPNRSVLEYRHKGNKENINKTERARTKKRAALKPLSDSFFPDEERKALCTNNGHDINFMIQKFKALSKKRGEVYADSQAAFELFVLNEKTTLGTTPKTTQKTTLTVVETQKPYVIEKEDMCTGCRRPKIYCRCAHKLEEGSRKIQDIMKRFLK